MSRKAIAAVLARTDLASGERLVALSLASFAGRDNRAWPGAPAASARAGLSRSRYQHARDQLVARGLVAVDERVTGRGRASTLTLLFADAGPWWDGDINVELFEAVLTHSPVRGPERLLLSTMAALADRARRRMRPVDGAAVRCGGDCRPDLPARAHRPARVGPTGPGQRRWRPWKQERMDRGRPARWRRRAGRSKATARRATGRRAAAGGLDEFTSPAGTSVGARQKGRSRSDSFTRKVSCPDRGFRPKGRSGSDSFTRKVSCPDRGFRPKGRSGSDTFRARATRNPGKNPGKNPGSQRARGEGTPEPQNQERPPQPP